MAVSFEDAVDTLLAMFPSWDKSALSELLLSNQNHMERTVEAVLMMEDPSSVSTVNTSSASSNMNTNPSVPTDSFNSSFPPIPPSSDSRNYPSNTTSNNTQYRGIRCTLPGDFLRPPSQYPMNDNIMADEQLALMLQNELFQREVRDALGDEFMYNYIRPQPNRPVGSNSGIQANNTNSNQGGNNSVPDLGILKGLSSVGETAKRTLSQLATKFKSSNSGSGNSGNSGEQYGVTNAMHRGGSREKEQEMRSLVNSTDDDEDGAEVISFETNRGSSGHALDNSTYNTSFNYNNNNGGTI